MVEDVSIRFKPAIFVVASSARPYFVIEFLCLLDLTVFKKSQLLFYLLLEDSTLEVYNYRTFNIFWGVLLMRISGCIKKSSEDLV